MKYRMNVKKPLACLMLLIGFPSVATVISPALPQIGSFYHIVRLIHNS